MPTNVNSASHAKPLLNAEITSSETAQTATSSPHRQQGATHSGWAYGYPVHQFNPHALHASCNAYSGDVRPAMGRSGSYLSRISQWITKRYTNSINGYLAQTAQTNPMFRLWNEQAGKIHPSLRFGLYNPAPNMPASSAVLGYYMMPASAYSYQPLPPGQSWGHPVAYPTGGDTLHNVQQRYQAMYPDSTSGQTSHIKTG